MTARAGRLLRTEGGGQNWIEVPLPETADHLFIDGRGDTARIGQPRLAQQRAEISREAFLGYLKMWTTENLADQLGPLATQTLVLVGAHVSPAGGFAKAVEMCNNNGHCRKFDAGTMCPSYRVTRDEQHLTRGRANTLRLAGRVLSASLEPDVPWHRIVRADGSLAAAGEEERLLPAPDDDGSRQRQPPLPAGRA